MKKLICTVLIASMLFSIIACDAKTSESKKDLSSEESAVSILSADTSKEFETKDDEESSEEQSLVSDASMDTPIITPSIAPDSSDDNDEVLYETIYKPIDYGLDRYYPNLFRCSDFWGKMIHRHGEESYYRVLILIDSQEYYEYKHKYLSDNMYFDPNNTFIYYPRLSLGDYIENYRWMYENDAQTVKSLGIDAEMQWAFYTRESEKRTMSAPDDVFYDYGFVATVRGDVLLGFINTMMNEQKYGGTVLWMKEGHNMQDLYYEYKGNSDSVYNIYVAEGPSYMQFVRS